MQKDFSLFSIYCSINTKKKQEHKNTKSKNTNNNHVFSGAWCWRFPAKFRRDHNDGRGGGARARQEPNHVQ